jgi:soluble lytic murein transglycosylase
MDSGSKVLIGIGVFLMALFIAMSLTIYDLKQDLKAQNTRVDQYEKLAADFYSNAMEEVLELHSAVSDTQETLNRNAEKISILDESVDSKDKRWAKIKKVREAIESTTTTPPPILDLTRMASAVVDYSDQYDVEVSLVLGVIKRESNFNYRAVSHAGANGLMQIMPATGKEISADIGKRSYSLFNIRDNIRFGVYYLRKMLYRFDGDMELAVRAYNCGPTYTEKVVAGEYQNYPEETVKYLEAVSRWKQEYENLGL